MLSNIFPYIENRKNGGSSAACLTLFQSLVEIPGSTTDMGMFCVLNQRPALFKQLVYLFTHMLSHSCWSDILRDDTICVVFIFYHSDRQVPGYQCMKSSILTSSILYTIILTWIQTRVMNDFISIVYWIKVKWLMQCLKTWLIFRMK